MLELSEDIDFLELPVKLIVRHLSILSSQVDQFANKLSLRLWLQG